MVELSDPSGPIKEGIDNSIFIVPCIIVVILVSYFGYKLVRSIRDKQIAKDEKKRQKQLRREKEQAKKMKKR